MDILKISVIFLLILLVALAINNTAKLIKHYKVALLFGAVTVIFRAYNPLVTEMLKSDEMINTPLNVAFLSIVVNGLIYFLAAAEWEKLKTYTLPWLWKSEAFSWGPFTMASAGGIIIGMVVGFFILIFSAETCGDGYFHPNAVYRLFYTLLMAVLFALVEELLFRGAIFAFLLRVSSRKISGIVISTIGVSLLWVIMHQRDFFVIYIGLFIGGIVLCELARRWGIETAIGAHCSYNAAVFSLNIFWKVDDTFDHTVIGIIILSALLWAGVTIARKFTDNKAVRKALRIIFTLSFIIGVIILANASSYERSEQTINYGVFAFTILLAGYLIILISKINILFHRLSKKGLAAHTAEANANDAPALEASFPENSPEDTGDASQAPLG